MKNKARKPVKGILKIGVMVPITDPAEQAKVDRLFREAGNPSAPRDAHARKAKPRKGK